MQQALNDVIVKPSASKMLYVSQVGDFGLSKIKRNTLVTGGVRGTLPWMAPELLNGSSSKVSEKVNRDLFNCTRKFQKTENIHFC